MTKANSCLQVSRQPRTAGQGCCQHTPQALPGLRGGREDAQLELSSAFLPSFGHLLPRRGTLRCSLLPSRDRGCASPGIPVRSLAPLPPLLISGRVWLRCSPSFLPCRPFCDSSLPDSKQQMVLFTQEIRLFIFQSHRHLRCRLWSSLNNEPSGELVFLFVSFS